MGRRFLFTLTAFCSALFFSAFIVNNNGIAYSFPYKQAGLTERQAAAHLLNRFTYGATPGQIDEVVKMGLEKWFDQQLSGKLADPKLTVKLSGYNAINLTNKEVIAQYPKNGEILRLAIQKGLISKDSAGKADKKEYKDLLANLMKEKGYKPRQELFREFINQKILRATYTNNQLQEVLTDFWFNHFNVSITKPQCAEFIPAYERDVIRPNVYGKFSSLLMATAKSPAMLYYLDNFSSSGINQEMNDPMQKGNNNPAAAKRLAALKNNPQMAAVADKIQQNKKAQGLNENYAREVMELHTLGVDGGYTQQDVTQAAKVLTGWTVYPMGEYGAGNALQKIIDKTGEGPMQKRGFVHEGDFLYVPARHEGGEKTVLGKKFSGGYQEGVALLTMLAEHPSTAKFITKKLAVRFVSDSPSEVLTGKMAKTFTATGGDIRQVMIAMVSSPEFWSKEAVREKTKSPFELAISTVRSLNAEVNQPYQLYTWITKMGQKMYYYQAPTGFPDNGQYWINSGSLLNRMNFGLSLAAQKIPGIRINLLALNKNHEPESPEDALEQFSRLIMPERDLAETIKRLSPMLNDKELSKKIEVAANEKQAKMAATGGEDDVMMGGGRRKEEPAKPAAKNALPAVLQKEGNTMLAQVVGVIIGSPEFQRK